MRAPDLLPLVCGASPSQGASVIHTALPDLAWDGD